MWSGTAKSKRKESCECSIRARATWYVLNNSCVFLISYRVFSFRNRIVPSLDLATSSKSVTRLKKYSDSICWYTFFYQGVGRYLNSPNNTCSRCKCYSKALISASSSQPGGAILSHFNLQKPDSTMTSENKLVRKAYCRWQSNCYLPSWSPNTLYVCVAFCFVLVLRVIIKT